MFKLTERLTIIRLLAEVQGVFEALEIQSQPLTERQKSTLDMFVKRIEIELDRLVDKSSMDYQTTT